MLRLEVREFLKSKMPGWDIMTIIQEKYEGKFDMALRQQSDKKTITVTIDPEKRAIVDNEKREQV